MFFEKGWVKSPYNHALDYGVQTALLSGVVSVADELRIEVAIYRENDGGVIMERRFEGTGAWIHASNWKEKLAREVAYWDNCLDEYPPKNTMRVHVPSVKINVENLVDHVAPLLIQEGVKYSALGRIVEVIKGCLPTSS